ncbi:MAG: saccharopine dehydrogenase C-terminal domain-containing protein [Conexivisphaerales archaeon]
MIVTVLGAGMMGSEIALDLASKTYVDQLAVVDNSHPRLQLLHAKAKERLRDNHSKISTYVIDIVNEKDALQRLLRRSDAAVGALPHSVARFGVENAVEAEVDYVDLIYSWSLQEQSEQLNKQAKRRGIAIIPACGLAPGLSNILAKRAVEEVGGEAEELTIYVGGIPQRPEPPLEYKVVFSAESVLEEYTRDALVVRKGERVLLPALSEVEEVCFSSLPNYKFEAFVTDGLSTLPLTTRAMNMTEKTVRWPGHSAKIRLLAQLGLLSEETLAIDGGIIVTPRKLLERLFMLKLSMTEHDRDMTLLKVTAKSDKTSASYEMIDRYDEVTKTTSMARTTGYPCSIVVQFLLERKLTEKGFLPPEEAVSRELFQDFLNRLKEKGIEVVRQ